MLRRLDDPSRCQPFRLFGPVWLLDEEHRKLQCDYVRPRGADVGSGRLHQRTEVLLMTVVTVDPLLALRIAIAVCEVLDEFITRERKDRCDRPGRVAALLIPGLRDLRGDEIAAECSAGQENLRDAGIVPVQRGENRLKPAAYFGLERELLVDDVAELALP